MKENIKIVVKYLDDYGLDIFSLQVLEKANILGKRQLRLALQNLIRSGYIDSIERGKYCRHNFRDHFIIGSFVTPDGVISYWNALNFHGLTEQIPNVVFIKTRKFKQNKDYFGVKYIFTLKKTNLGGYRTEGVGNHKFRISDLEQTIVDSFDKPHFSGGYAEIVKAFNRANINFRKITRYCRERDVISITKRLAYLTELLNKKNSALFLEYANSVLNKKFTLFESDGDPTGKTNRRWRLILNIPEEEILEMAQS
jgi:predicted transcriptional regulator of viral defense system